MTEQTQLNGNEVLDKPATIALYHAACQKFAQSQVRQVQMHEGKVDIVGFLVNVQIIAQVQDELIKQLALKHGLDELELFTGITKRINEMADFTNNQPVIITTQKQ